MYEIRMVETNMELLEKVLFKENLNMAYKRVYKDKWASGVDGVATEKLFVYIKGRKEEILWKIKSEN